MYHNTHIMCSIRWKIKHQRGQYICISKVEMRAEVCVRPQHLGNSTTYYVGDNDLLKIHLLFTGHKCINKTDNPRQTKKQGHTVNNTGVCDALCDDTNIIVIRSQ